MLDSSRINEISKTVAQNLVARGGLERVITEPTIDSEGNEALRIILVLKPDAAKMMTGDEALDLLVGIQQSLFDDGEERLPIIEYATEQEILDQGDDEESA